MCLRLAEFVTHAPITVAIIHLLASLCWVFSKMLVTDSIPMPSRLRQSAVEIDASCGLRIIVRERVILQM
jgi:uncharacterized membrane protein